MQFTSSRFPGQGGGPFLGPVYPCRLAQLEDFERTPYYRKHLRRLKKQYRTGLDMASSAQLAIYHTIEQRALRKIEINLKTMELGDTPHLSGLDLRFKFISKWRSWEQESVNAPNFRRISDNRRSIEH